MLKWEDAYILPGDFGHEHFANYLKFVLQKIVFIIHTLSAIEVFPRTLPKTKFYRPTLVNPHMTPCDNFFHNDIFNVKRPQPSKNIKVVPITPGS